MLETQSRAKSSTKLEPRKTNAHQQQQLYEPGDIPRLSFAVLTRSTRNMSRKTVFESQNPLIITN